MEKQQVELTYDGGWKLISNISNRMMILIIIIALQNFTIITLLTRIVKLLNKTN